MEWFADSARHSRFDGGTFVTASLWSSGRHLGDEMDTKRGEFAEGRSVVYVAAQAGTRRR